MNATSRTLASLVFVVLWLGSITWFFSRFSGLPGEVVTRYAADGSVDTTLSKAAFTALFLFVHLFFAAYFCAGRFFMHKVSARYLKLVPDHAYWLAESRRDATYLALSAMNTWAAVFICALFAATFGLIGYANTGGAVPRFSLLTSFLNTIFLTLIFGLVIVFRRRFRLPPGIKEAQTAKDPETAKD